ncbi:hypothetical protein [Chitinophaga qingshengii]|uniref:Transposase n=1 Tax=Chitinophaga qingshengii TaxID=1569794 RepID=A0ABR7TT62_9BACT|nr:hypothetical protein [Chitinophaga qingshengii]MBC9933646.1 hypothetical protein [Chitinophaga qingshengii]
MSKDSPNLLFAIHEKFAGMATLFRERVCQDCNWSTPTFYRKMRAKEGARLNADKNKLSSYLSSAESKRVVEIMDEVYNSFWKDATKIRNKHQL